jgi:hypothetical protein
VRLHAVIRCHVSRYRLYPQTLSQVATSAQSNARTTLGHRSARGILFFTSERRLLAEAALA